MVQVEEMTRLTEDKMLRVPKKFMARTMVACTSNPSTWESQANICEFEDIHSETLSKKKRGP